MGCMPYGPRVGDPGAVLGEVSIPHMGCMPYGLQARSVVALGTKGFNPSYGLHALRAPETDWEIQSPNWVSIPHMGCMPYGR